MNSTSCHPERSLAIRQTQSKDPYSTADSVGNFRITVRFFAEEVESQGRASCMSEKKASNPVGITRIAFNTNDVTTILQ
jgi:hypothetical protein